MINFKLTKSEKAVVEKIVSRACEIAEKSGKQYDRKTCDMDITATHLNGCPLDLSKLLYANDFNFAHDVFQIGMHLDRKTGKLSNHFLPRCSINDKTHREFLDEISKLIDLNPDAYSPEAARLEIIAHAVSLYEKIKFPFNSPPYEMLYSRTNGGRLIGSNGGGLHIVAKANFKTLCGRDASDWKLNVLPWDPANPCTCKTCWKKLVKIEEER